MGERIATVLGGAGKVGIATVPGQFNLEERIRGIKDVFAEKYPDLEIAATVDDGNDDSKCADAVVAMLQAHPDINLVTSMNAVGAGVAAGLRQTGQAGKIKAVVFDITDPILDGVADGTLDSTIVQRTYMMTYVGVHLLYRYNHPSDYLDNWESAGIGVLPNIVDTGVMVVTADQVDVFRAK
jgi:ribose transport system substrate-binding protein